MLYKEDRALCLAWDKVGRLTYFGSPYAVRETSKLSQAAKLEFWFRFNKSVVRLLYRGFPRSLPTNSETLTCQNQAKISQFFTLRNLHCH